MIDQIGIAMTGVTAIFLTQAKSPKWQRYACLFGMAGQPFWIYSAWHAGQWGILALTALYTAAWAKGIWSHWAKGKISFTRLPGPQWHLIVWGCGLHCYGPLRWAVSAWIAGKQRYWSTQ